MIELEPISKSEAARYMGVKGEIDRGTAELLDRYEPIVRQRLRPAFVYREAVVTEETEGIRAEGLPVLLTGEDIKRHLKGCKRAVFFAATVSAEADKLIRQTAVTDVAGALAVDALCSAAVEQLCDLAEKAIFAEVEAKFRTWRFSPGYGDLPITVQSALADMLNTRRRIGLTVSEGSLLIPTKSVTAIIGICEKPPENVKKGCATCNMRDRCSFRVKSDEFRVKSCCAAKS